jgi:hypothetical protein
MIEQWTVAESDVVMNTILETADGVVRGLSDDGVLSFKGIPFAAPPVGDLRFAPPAAPQPWPDERDCTRYTTVSLQPPDPLSVMIPACESNYYHPGTVQGEDCLNLNVWTPALKRFASRPGLDSRRRVPDRFRHRTLDGRDGFCSPSRPRCRHDQLPARRAWLPRDRGPAERDWVSEQRRPARPSSGPAMGSPEHLCFRRRSRAHLPVR